MSEVFMQGFRYYYLKNKYENNSRLLFTDIDGFSNYLVI